MNLTNKELNAVINHHAGRIEFLSVAHPQDVGLGVSEEEIEREIRDRSERIAELSRHIQEQRADAPAE
jgi:hypothetical protein